MYGEDVRRLRILLRKRPDSAGGDEAPVTVVFQKEGNYGDNWNYGQATLPNTTDATVSILLHAFTGCGRNEWDETQCVCTCIDIDQRIVPISDTVDARVHNR